MESQPRIGSADFAIALLETRRKLADLLVAKVLRKLSGQLVINVCRFSDQLVALGLDAVIKDRRRWSSACARIF